MHNFILQAGSPIVIDFVFNYVEKIYVENYELDQNWADLALAWLWSSGRKCFIYSQIKRPICKIIVFFFNALHWYFGYFVAWPGCVNCRYPPKPFMTWSSSSPLMNWLDLSWILIPIKWQCRVYKREWQVQVCEWPQLSRDYSVDQCVYELTFHQTLQHTIR